VQVSEHHAELQRRGASVLVLSFGRPDVVEGYRRRLALPFPVAADPERRAYAAYGLLTGSTWAIWHPRVLLRYLVLLLRGLPLRRPARDDDLAQLGGDFVIGADGVLRFAYRSRRPDDRPDVAALLAALPEV
jgi:peroxiredoxin